MKEQGIINELKNCIIKIKEEILNKEEILDNLQEELEILMNNN